MALHGNTMLQHTPQELKKLSNCFTLDELHEICGDVWTVVFVAFLKQVPNFFSCLGGYCSAVLL